MVKDTSLSTRISERLQYFLKIHITHRLKLVSIYHFTRYLSEVVSNDTVEYYPAFELN